MKPEPEKNSMPTPSEIRQYRKALKITQKEAAALIGIKSSDTWRSWERPQHQPGARRMPECKWEYFKVKAACFNAA
jgi:DNA-binding transcriptional regulator YiaG